MLYSRIVVTNPDGSVYNNSSVMGLEREYVQWVRDFHEAAGRTVRLVPSLRKLYATDSFNPGVGGSLLSDVCSPFEWVWSRGGTSSVELVGAVDRAARRHPSNVGA